MGNICISCEKIIIGKVSKRMCKKCYDKKRYEENLDKISKRVKKYYERNKEKLKIKHKKYREKNSNKIKIWYEKYHKENPEKAREYSRRYYQKNKKKANAATMKWQKENPNKVRESSHRSYYKNSEKFRAKSLKWKKENPEKRKATYKKWYKENEEKERKRSNKWKKENSEKIRISNRKWQKANPKKLKQYRDKPNANIAMRLRGRLWTALNIYTKEGKIKSSDEYGINYKAIIEHLKPFPKDRHLYHIDHIKPLCSFNFINKDSTQNLEEIKKAFDPENHQWLLKEDNLSKGGKWGTKEQVRYLFL